MYTEFLICIKKILMYIVRTDSFHLKLSINTSKSVFKKLYAAMIDESYFNLWTSECLLQACSKLICMVKCLPQACSNVHILFAEMFAASMQQQLRQVCSKRSQEAVLKWAWECLLQACRRPHLHGKMFAASLRQVCCMLAAMPFSHGIKF